MPWCLWHNRPAVAFAVLLGAVPVAAAAGSCSRADLARAHQRVPRTEWKGGDFVGMSAVLNAHLARSGYGVRHCEHWTVSELQELQARLFAEADDALLAIYAAAADNRRQRFTSQEALAAHWAAVDAAAATSDALGQVRRDGLCHEAVMWWVHHLPHTVQKRLGAEGLSLPSLPTRRHAPAPSDAPGAVRAVHAEYAQQVSCQQCHTGRLSGDLTNATLPPPLPVDKEHPGLERKRVCDFQSEPPCGPCDGLGGARWGDSPETMTPMQCEVLHGPEVPPTTKGRYPALAAVNLTGESRWPIAVTPDGPGKYVKVDGKLYLGWKDGVMRMRYDFGGMAALIQAQTLEQAKQMDPGATMVEQTGSCSCQASVAGNMHIRAFEADDPLDPLQLPPQEGGAAYLGRVKVQLDGHTGRRNRTAVADHFMKWAFHFLVDADASSPSFGLPLRLYGPFGCLQVFDGWVLGDPSTAHRDLWKMPASCNITAPACSVFEQEVEDKPLVV